VGIFEGSKFWYYLLLRSRVHLPATRLGLSALRTLPPRRALRYSLSLFDRHELIRGDIGDVILRTARPLDVDRADRLITAEPEGQRKIALRQVARPAADHAPLLS